MPNDAMSNNIDEVAKHLRLSSEQIAHWRSSYKKKQTFGTGRAKGKLKRPSGMLSVGDIFKLYGIRPNLQRLWRGAGLPYEYCETMVLVSEEVLKQWTERNRVALSPKC